MRERARAGGAGKYCPRDDAALAARVEAALVGRVRAGAWEIALVVTLAN
jgi:hypothetical protein